MAYKSIEISEGKKLELTSNGLTLVLYQEIFHDDLLKALTSSAEGNLSPTETVTMVARLAYVMNRQAEGELKKVGKDDFYYWLSTFGSVELFDYMAEVIECWNENTGGSSKPKNA